MTKEIDWKNLGFGYMQTKSHIVYTWKNGSWNQGELVQSPYLNIHIASTSLHYGQAAFEGLKAFTCKDGKVRVFRMEENAKRLQRSAERTFMPEVPTEMFSEAVQRVIADNQAYIPPYGTGGSLYIRPLLIGSGAEMGVKPSVEYTFIVMVMPVGPYYTNGLTPVKALIQDQYDRAAPQGVGDIKVAGNYAAGLYAQAKAQAKGYPIALYLDAKEHNYIDEFGTSNFVGIKTDGTYVTPKSHSVLPSITNKSLQQIAEDLGYKVDVRPVPYSELTEFAEIGACGTAVVITLIESIDRNDDHIAVPAFDQEQSVLSKLYNRIQAIQYGEVEDLHNWMTEVPL
jgi:branched-chain amino acid aminotransferase